MLPFLADRRRSARRLVKMNKVLVALLAVAACVSGAKPTVTAHSNEEGQALAQDLLNDAMNRMGKTTEGAKKMAADPSMYKKYADAAGARENRKLAEASTVATGKTNMRAYTPEQGRIKGAQVMAERKAAREAKKAAAQQ